MTFIPRIHANTLAERTRLWRANGRLTEDDLAQTAAMAPDPYAQPLQTLRAAMATPLSAFEDRWKAARLEALTAESRRREDHFNAHPSPRLTAAELSDYAPPNSYAEPLRKMRSEGR